MTGTSSFVVVPRYTAQRAGRCDSGPLQSRRSIERRESGTAAARTQTAWAMTMVLIPSGTFVRQTPNPASDGVATEPQRVVLTQPFWC